MGVMMTRETDRNANLTERISADLRNRAQVAKTEEDPDFEKDSAYLEETKTTSKFIWFWIVLVVLAVISLVCIIFV